MNIQQLTIILCLLPSFPGSSKTPLRQLLWCTSIDAWFKIFVTSSHFNWAVEHHDSSPTICCMSSRIYIERTKPHFHAKIDQTWIKHWYIPGQHCLGRGTFQNGSVHHNHVEECHHASWQKRGTSTRTIWAFGRNFLLSTCKILLCLAKDVSSSPVQLSIHVCNSSNAMGYVYNLPAGISEDKRDTDLPGCRGFSRWGLELDEGVLFLLLSRWNSLKAFFKLVMMAPYILHSIGTCICSHKITLRAWLTVTGHVHVHVLGSREWVCSI